jgi:predicted HAD superfamily Cof-like phosphohydrolase
MDKLDTLNQVAEFHKTNKAPILDTPQIPPQDRCDLRVSLLQEELDELKEAINNYNIIEIADALADLQYVLSGAVLEFGLGNKFPALSDEVHRSNMSKSCETREEAQKTVEFYKQKDNTEAHIEESEGRFIVFRTKDNKVLKSINYSPASLGEIIYNNESTDESTQTDDVQTIINDYKADVKWDEETGTVELKPEPRAVIQMDTPKQTGGPQSGGLGNVY